MRVQKLKQAVRHLNPFIWLRSLYIFVVTGCYLSAYYFGSILIVLLIGLMAFFALDRYSADADAGNGRYISPFSRKAVASTFIETHATETQTDDDTFYEMTPSTYEPPVRQYYSIQDEVNRRLKEIRQQAKTAKSRY